MAAYIQSFSKARYIISSALRSYDISNVSCVSEHVLQYLPLYYVLHIVSWVVVVQCQLRVYASHNSLLIRVTSFTYAHRD